MRFNTLTEMKDVIPDGIEEFEVSQKEYDHYVSLLFVEPKNYIATFRGTKLIVIKDEQKE